MLIILPQPLQNENCNCSHHQAMSHGALVEQRFVRSSRNKLDLVRLTLLKLGQLGHLVNRSGMKGALTRSGINMQ